MKNILVIKTSVNGEKSISNQVVNQLIARLGEKYTALNVIERDLDANAVPLLSSETAPAIRAGVSETENQRRAIALSDELINELKSADHIVIALPRYNFTAPATFKTYIDYVARPRITFQYGANGPEGMLPSVPVTVVIASGGQYAGQSFDFMSGWVKQVLTFIGLQDVSIVYAEGVASNLDNALAEVNHQLDKLLNQ